MEQAQDMVIGKQSTTLRADIYALLSSEDSRTRRGGVPLDSFLLTRFFMLKRMFCYARREKTEGLSQAGLLRSL
jgi:hypothetical protein